MENELEQTIVAFLDEKGEVLVIDWGMVVPSIGEEVCLTTTVPASDEGVVRKAQTVWKVEKVFTTVFGSGMTQIIAFFLQVSPVESPFVPMEVQDKVMDMVKTRIETQKELLRQSGLGLFGN